MDRPPFDPRPTTRRRLKLLAALALAGCGGGGTTDPPPPPPPPTGAISLALSVLSGTIQQGQQASITAVVNRQGSFTGSVTIAVENLPTGVTATQSGATTSGSSTTVTITFAVTTSAAVGRTDLTIRASGAGVTDATGPYSLTVTAAPVAGYQLGVTGSPLTISQGGNGQAIVTLARTGGFAGSVSLTVEGAPAGLTVILDPTSTTGSQVTLTAIAAAGLTPNTYSLTIRGTATGLADRTVPIQVVVTAVTGTGNVVLDFSGCGSPYAIWVAYRDGTGPWTRVTSGTALFQFSVSSPTAAYAYVVRQSAAGATTTNVVYRSRAELSRTPIVFCPAATIGLKIINGSVAALTGQQAVYLTMGTGFALATPLFPTFLIAGVLDGPRDLVAYRVGSLPGATDRVIIRRDVNQASGTSVGALDFAAAEAATVATGTLTVTGLVGGEGLLETMRYLTRATCDAGMIYQTNPINAIHTYPGVPASVQRDTDFHLLRIDASTATTSRRVEEVFQTVANRTMPLGGRIGNPVVTTLTGAYKRLEAVFGLPFEYDVEARIRYLQTSGTPRIVEISASPAWIAAATATLTMPDFSAISGWSDTWAPGTSVATNWTITAVGGDATGSRCREGSRFLQATASGTN